jgi:hypothetical protein
MENRGKSSRSLVEGGERDKKSSIRAERVHVGKESRKKTCRFRSLHLMTSR